MKKSLKIPIEYEHEVYIHENINAKKLYVLLHGFSQTGEFIFKKLKDYLPGNSMIISPNGPFLYPISKNDQYIARYAWYFYDSKVDNFYINYVPGANYVANIIKKFNSNNLPVVIIGYSQGGYLAPKLAEIDQNIESVIGMGCKFKLSRFKFNPNVSYHQIHAKDDEVVIYKYVLEEFERLKSLGNDGNFISLDNSTHRLDQNYLESLKNLLQKDCL